MGTMGTKVYQLAANDKVATLDENNLVKAEQLPSYVDDVLEFSSYLAFPATNVAEAGKIYVAKDTNKTYRFSGGKFTVLSTNASTISDAENIIKPDLSYTHTTKTLVSAGTCTITALDDAGDVLETSPTLKSTASSLYTYFFVTNPSYPIWYRFVVEEDGTCHLAYSERAGNGVGHVPWHIVATGFGNRTSTEFDLTPVVDVGVGEDRIAKFHSSCVIGNVTTNTETDTIALTSNVPDAVTVDTTLDASSENPIQNKAVTVELEKKATAEAVEALVLTRAPATKPAESVTNLADGTVAVNDVSKGTEVTEDGSPIVNVVFEAATGELLRFCELLVTNVESDGAVSLSLPSGTYQFSDGADTVSKGNNHFCFAEYARNCWIVTKTVVAEASA